MSDFDTLDVSVLDAGRPERAPGEPLLFLMRELAGSNPNVRIHTAQDWKGYDDLAEKMHKYKSKWFCG